MQSKVYLGLSGATKAAATGGGSTVWSSGLCRPDTSLASILLHATPADVRYPASACAGRGFTLAMLGLRLG